RSVKAIHAVGITDIARHSAPICSLTSDGIDILVANLVLLWRSNGLAVMQEYTKHLIYGRLVQNRKVVLLDTNHLRACHLEARCNGRHFPCVDTQSLLSPPVPSQSCCTP